MNCTLQPNNALHQRIASALFSALLIFMVNVSAIAQGIKSPCISDQVLQQQILEDPTIVDRMNWFNQYAENFKPDRTRGEAVRIIPVVFHVFHANGTENISKAQIENQMDIINKDYRRENADTGNLNPVFKGYGTSMNIQFRLATLDPDGNCTDGIVRYYTPLTNNADNNIKKLSVWAPDRYLNIWVVKNIKDQGYAIAGTILGYAQFPYPGSGFAYSDGVLIRSDHIGMIETAEVADAGRVATHEIGHWFGLIHPFQDSCLSGDKVLDTPPVAEPNFGCNPKNSCDYDKPDLPDMIENYMDYADGSCQNIFTHGQKERVDAAIKSYRWYYSTPSNLVATGTQDGAPASQCAPIAAFDALVATDCEGSSVTFSDYSYNSKINSWSWSFPGGTPATSTSQNPTINYYSAGIYDVTLTVTGPNGTQTITKPAYVNVSPRETWLSGVAEGMENTNFPYEWSLDGTSAYSWKRTTQAKNSGSASMMIENSYALVDDKIDITSPNINLSLSSDKMFSFSYAYTPRYIPSAGSSTQDKLTVFVSTNCGKTWTAIWNKTGSLLNTLPDVVKNPYYYYFYATQASDWRRINVDLKSYGNTKNLLIKFEFTSKGGHNIFIDDINLGTYTGVDEVVKVAASMEIFPNPVSESTTIQYEIDSKSTVQLSVYDITGRKIVQPVNETKTQGVYEVVLEKQKLQLAAGTYMVELKTEAGVITRKMIVL